MDVLIALSIIVVLIVVYANAIATLGVVYDHELNSFQKIVQLLFVWLVPVFGASFVLHFVYEHSPDSIPKSWIPWPIRWLIFGKERKPNPNRDDFGFDDGHIRLNDASDFGAADDGGGDGGGD
jgi:hypothetical protein